MLITSDSGVLMPSSGALIIMSTVWLAVILVPSLASSAMRISSINEERVKYDATSAEVSMPRGIVKNVASNPASNDAYQHARTSMSLVSGSCNRLVSTVLPYDALSAAIRSGLSGTVSDLIPASRMNNSISNAETLSYLWSTSSQCRYRRGTDRFSSPSFPIASMPISATCLIGILPLLCLPCPLAYCRMSVPILPSSRESTLPYSSGVKSKAMLESMCPPRGSSCINLEKKTDAGAYYIDTYVSQS